MNRFPSHQPPPPTVVAALVRAGLSRATAMAMERWKAEEVLELLNLRAGSEGSGGLEGPRPPRGSI